MGSCEEGEVKDYFKYLSLSNKVDNKVINRFSKKRRDLLKRRMDLVFNVLNFRY